MSWEKLAQNRIEEAFAAGEFDDLPGRGLPLDLAEYFSQPATERSASKASTGMSDLRAQLELEHWRPMRDSREGAMR